MFTRKVSCKWFVSVLVGVALSSVTGCALLSPANQAPVAAITAPADGDLFTQGEAITFAGTAVDPEDGVLSGASLVWSSSIDGQLGTGQSVVRNDLSVGSHVITLIATDSQGATGVKSVTIQVLPPVSNKMYWTESKGGVIRRANLDGSDVESIVTGSGLPISIALDLVNGKMYWADRLLGKIRRAELDGSGIVDVITGLDNPRGLALDLAGGKLYWTEYFVGKIRRANLDGSGVEDLITGLERPYAITLGGD